MAVKLSRYARRVQKWYLAGFYNDESLEQLLQEYYKELPQG